MPTGRITPFGFEWGAANLTRLCDDEKKGWVMLGLKTPRNEIQIYVTKTGKIRVHDKDGNEWLPDNGDRT